MYRFFLQDNTLITPSVRLITLTPDTHNTEQFIYQAGQYAAISLHNKTRPTTTRCFSLTSSPAQKENIQFSIRVRGKFTSALERLKKGDLITVRGPFGNFVIDEQTQSPVTFFAGGIGIAPFIAMLRYISDTKLNTSIRLVYSCRSEEDIPFFEELQSLEQVNKNIHVTYVLGSGKTLKLRNNHVIQGKVDSDSLKILGLEYSTGTFMICGPTSYMHTVQTLLRERGVPEAMIQTEAFNQGISKKNNRLFYWPANMYALTGVFFLLSTGLIVATDLTKTLPKFKITNSSQPVETSSIYIPDEKTLLGSINAVKPLVDTDISQDPIITYIPNPQNAVLPVTESKPTPVAIAPVATSEPTVVKKVPTDPPKTTSTPSPTPIVRPTTPPRSTVS